MLDIKRLRELCEKATPGPWTVIGEDSWNVKGFPQVEMNTPDVHYFPVHNDADAQFIAAARTALPEALDEIERLRKALKLACSKLAYYVDKVPTLENKDNVPETVAECWELYFLEKVRGKRDDNLRV